MKLYRSILFVAPAVLLIAAIALVGERHEKESRFLDNAEDNARELIDQGRHIFRFDTYGDEAFWTGQLQIQKSVQGLSPRTALTLGLKVDAEALSPSVVEAIRRGRVNLGDPTVTLQLIRQN